MSSVIGKGITALVAAATLASVAAPAEGRRWRHHNNDDAALAIGAGIIGLGVVAALASNRGRYYDGYYDYYDGGYYDRGYYGGRYYRPRYYYYGHNYYRPRHYGYGYRHHRRWRDRDWDDHRWRGRRGHHRDWDRRRRWRDRDDD
jgi:hypothetical protein